MAIKSQRKKHQNKYKNLILKLKFSLEGSTSIPSLKSAFASNKSLIRTGCSDTLNKNEG